MIGMLAEHSGFTASEIESFDAPTVTWWWNMIMASRQHFTDMEK